jgi:hypothetical protein
MTYHDRILEINAINLLLKRNPLDERTSKTISNIIENFAHLSEIDKMCVFEYLIFRCVK